MPIFIQVYITKDVVKSVECKRAGSAGPGGMDLEALQGWLLKYGYDIKNFVLVLNILWTGLPIRAHLGPPIRDLCMDSCLY